jgi:type II secretory pathway component PulM
MQLTRREKWVVLGGLGGLALLAAMQFVVRPTQERVTTLRRVVKDKTEILTRIQDKSLEFQSLQTEIDRLQAKIAQQQESGRILSVIEGIRKSCDLPDKALSLRPTTAPLNEQYTQTTVEMRLEAVTLAQLIRFLSELDSLNLAGGIKSLDIRTTDRNVGLLQAVIQLATVLPAEGT